MVLLDIKTISLYISVIGVTMPKPYNLTNKRFGNLVVVSSSNSNGKSPWICKCDCGNNIILDSNELVYVGKLNCGCLNKTKNINFNTTKNKISTTQATWYSMKERCYNKKNNTYKNYGGRGIKICDRWLESYDNFLKDMGEKPINKSIERIDNNGNYEPSNCRWATVKEQANNRRNTLLYTYKNKSKSLSYWSDISGNSKNLMYYRLTHGWTIEDVIENKLIKGRCNR
jgi:hypothetical protein